MRLEQRVGRLEATRTKGFTPMGHLHLFGNGAPDPVETCTACRNEAASGPRSHVIIYLPVPDKPPDDARSS